MKCRAVGDAQMQRDECRRFLESYREAKLEAIRQSDGLENLWAQATGTTARLSATPRGGSGDSGNLLAVFSDAVENAGLRLAEAERRKLEVEKFIDSVPGDMNRMILRYRYVELLSWPRIQARMESAGVYYGERNLYKMHSRALKAAREAWRKKPNG